MSESFEGLILREMPQGVKLHSFREPARRSTCFGIEYRGEGILARVHDKEMDSIRSNAELASLVIGRWMSSGREKGVGVAHLEQPRRALAIEAEAIGR